MWDFMFEIIESGEQFFVECNSFEKAKAILKTSGFTIDELEFCGRYPVEEAEMMGLDTY